MTGAIPRSLMTDAELRAHAHDAGDDGREHFFVPTPAGVAYAGSHLGVPQARQYDIFVGDPDGAQHQGGESTGPQLPEGRERPEGDARVDTRAGLLARLAAHDEALILALGIVLCILAIAIVAASAQPGWIQ